MLGENREGLGAKDSADRVLFHELLLTNQMSVLVLKDIRLSRLR